MLGKHAKGMLSQSRWLPDWLALTDRSGMAGVQLAPHSRLGLRVHPWACGHEEGTAGSHRLHDILSIAIFWVCSSQFMEMNMGSKDCAKGWYAWVQCRIWSKSSVLPSISYSVFPNVFSFNTVIPYFAIVKYVFTLIAVKTLIIKWDGKYFYIYIYTHNYLWKKTWEKSHSFKYG